MLWYREMKGFVSEAWNEDVEKFFENAMFVSPFDYDHKKRKKLHFYLLTSR